MAAAEQTGVFASGLKMDRHRRGGHHHKKASTKPPEELLDYFKASAEIKEETGVRCLQIAGRIGDWGVKPEFYNEKELMDVLEHHNGFLTRLVLSGCDQVEDPALVFLKFCTQLRELNMNGCEKVTDRLMEGVAANCRTLKAVGLRRCNAITDAPVLEFAKSCPNLTALDLGYCVDVTDKGIEAVAKVCTSMTSFYISRGRD